MNSFKRLLSGAIMLTMVFVLFVFTNKYVVDIAMALVAMRAFYEYNNSCKDKARIMSWTGYAASAFIAFVHFIPPEYTNMLLGIMVPSVLAILFLQVVFSNLKWNFNDLVYTAVGICYVVSLIIFIPILYGTVLADGKILIWYVLFASWATDVFAYLAGKYFGKHKFSKVSPNKSIEGCIAGTIGATVFTLAYTYVVNTYFGQNISYVSAGIIGFILSILSQIGDFSASSIKRYLGIKDFSDLIPGHGGMLDRIDSVIFIAPFSYYLLTMFL